MIRGCINFVRELITPVTYEEESEATQILSQQDDIEGPISSNNFTSFACPEGTWGALYAFPGPNLQFDHIFLEKDEVVLGMKDFNSMDRTISSAHLKFQFNRRTGECTVKDLSLNGTYLNGFRLTLGKVISIRTGDAFSLVVPEGRLDSVAFCFYRIRKLNLLQDQSADVIVPKLLDPALQINVVYSELLCRICRKLPFNSVGFYPCGHTSCGTCALYGGASETHQCPQCLASIETMSRNHLLDLVVQTYQNMNPSCIESDGACLRLGVAVDEMLKRFAKEPPLPSYRPAKRGRFSSPAYTHTLRCRRCPGLNASRSDECGPATIHHECKACKTPFPSPANESIITCVFCQGKFCSVVFGCASPELRGAIGPLVMVHPHRPPRSWAWGNGVESESIRLAVEESGLSLKQIYLRILYLLFNREVMWEKSRLYEWGISPSNYGCRDCVSDIVLPELVFLCRHLLRTSSSGSRPSIPDCPSGRDCHVQHASLDHRENFNHYCPPNPYANKF